MGGTRTPDFVHAIWQPPWMPPSEPTVSEGNRVSWPILSAMNWSMETLPLGRFCASELRTPERNECTAK